MCHCLLEQHLNICPWDIGILSLFPVPMLYSAQQPVHVLNKQESHGSPAFLSADAGAERQLLPWGQWSQIHCLTFFCYLLQFPLSSSFHLHQWNEEDCPSLFSWQQSLWFWVWVLAAEVSRGSVLSHQEQRAVCQGGRKRAAPWDLQFLCSTLWRFLGCADRFCQASGSIIVWHSEDEALMTHFGWMLGPCSCGEAVQGKTPGFAQLCREHFLQRKKVFSGILTLHGLLVWLLNCKRDM